MTCDFCWWISPGTLVSSTNKNNRHDITEILLKVASNTINLNLFHFLCILQYWDSLPIMYFTLIPWAIEIVPFLCILPWFLELLRLSPFYVSYLDSLSYWDCPRFMYLTLIPWAIAIAPFLRIAFQLIFNSFSVVFSAIAGPSNNPATSPSRLWLRFKYSSFEHFWNIENNILHCNIY